MGQPYARSVTTMTINSVGVRKPANKVPACAKCLAAHLTAIPRTFSAMDDNIALPDLPSCHACLIRAKCLGGIHLFCGCFHMHSLQMNLPFSSLFGLLSTSKCSSTKYYFCSVIIFLI